MKMFLKTLNNLVLSLKSIFSFFLLNKFGKTGGNITKFTLFSSKIVLNFFQ